MAGALGFRLIVLPGFQPFEGRAYIEIGYKYPNAVYWDIYIREGVEAVKRWSDEHDFIYCQIERLREFLKDHQIII